MQRRYPNFDEFSLARVLGDAVRPQHEITDPLPQRWLELLSELDRVITEGPPTQPVQGEDGAAQHAAEPANLIKQLAQLEMRARADVERERWCKAVDRAVAELVRMGRGTPRIK
jgi:hypothetical protein